MPTLDNVKTALMTTNIVSKTTQVSTLYKAVQKERLIINGQPPEPIHRPPLPKNVELTALSNMQRRGIGTKQGHQSLLHAIAHIEYNAINLALDAVYRFRDMPYSYYVDWMKVANEEAYHFSLIASRMAELGCQYGDFPCHGGLWAMCVDTEHDVMIRMALVPRVMEARGLDVTPKIQTKLKNIKDIASVKLLDIIYQDEIGHVAIGSKWFKYCCKQRGLNTYQSFRKLLKTYLKNGMNVEFNEKARLQAGFDDMELALLTQSFKKE
ncbi:MAG: ferritin-like domain-containing protein [Ostreibacterium sp.]